MSFFEGQQWQLLPGIPDEVTLHLIVPKLAWIDVLGLPSISRKWKCAVENRDVYDLRMLAKTTEPLLVAPYFIHCKRTKKTGLVIQSSRDGVQRVLPGLPGLPGLLEWASYIATYDGKIYVLAIDSRVFSLDVAAGHTQWTECASMGQGKDFMMLSDERYIKNGKIHVHGISAKHDEVYDPKLNVWSSTTPVTPSERETFLLAI